MTTFKYKLNYLFVNKIPLDHPLILWSVPRPEKKKFILILTSMSLNFNYTLQKKFINLHRNDLINKKKKI